MHFAWFNYPMSFRSNTDNDFYPRWSYETLPPCPPVHKFSNINTIEDLKNILSPKKSLNGLTIVYPAALFGEDADSPTSCQFIFNHKYKDKKLFYFDQQCCEMWGLDDNGVYAVRGESYVSKTLSEFLWRICIENQVWHYEKYMKHDHIVKMDTWVPPKRYLLPTESVPNNDVEFYIDHYYELYKKTRNYLLQSNYGCTAKNIDKYLITIYMPNSLDKLDTNLDFSCHSDYLENNIIDITHLKYYDQLVELGLFENCCRNVSRQTQIYILDMIKKDMVNQ